MNKMVLVILTTLLPIGLCSCVNTVPTQPPSPPEYRELSFDLALSEGQEYDMYTFPIYIRSNQTLHLSFFVEQGDPIWFGFATPSGKPMGIVTSGDGFGLQEACCSQLLGGTMVFKPAEYGCGKGYYQMRPHMIAPSSKARVKVEYWIENPQ